MKRVIYSTIAFMLISVSLNASSNIDRNGEIKTSETADPIRCTGTLVIWQGSNPVDLKVVFNDDIGSKEDCDTWVKGQSDELQKKLGDNYQVKASASYAAPK